MTGMERSAIGLSINHEAGERRFNSTAKAIMETEAATPFCRSSNSLP